MCSSILWDGQLNIKWESMMIGETPIAPSSTGRDPVYMVKPREMTEGDIETVVGAFADAAIRAVGSGADGVQIQAAHGYLISQFLSPYFSKRRDNWGGSDVNRFRILKEIISAIKARIPKETAVKVKMNTTDFTPEGGITPTLAAVHAQWLDEMGIDGLELSCGTLSYSAFSIFRGDVPVDELVMRFPLWKKMFGRSMLRKLKGKYGTEEGYNLDAARIINPKLKNTALLVVGGIRKQVQMEHIIDQAIADFISMCRPFIREPFLVQKMQRGRTDSSSCVSCNRCFAAVANGRPLRCYVDGFPDGR